MQNKFNLYKHAYLTSFFVVESDHEHVQYNAIGCHSSISNILEKY